MLTLAETAALIAAIKSTVDLFDKLARPIKRILLPGRKYEQAEAKDQRWRFKIGTKGNDIVVRENGKTRKTVTGAELAKTLSPNDLALVRSYEQKMEDYFDQWRIAYAAKDARQRTAQLKKLIVSMRGELLGILKFLEQIGIHLDDHYMHVRSLVKKARYR